MTPTLQAYRKLLASDVPANKIDFLRAIMLAVLIGRELESETQD